MIANEKEIDEIEKFLDVDSLGYLSMEKMLDAMPHNNGQDYCTACFSGEYPIPIENEMKKESNEEK